MDKISCEIKKLLVLWRDPSFLSKNVYSHPGQQSTRLQSATQGCLIFDGRSFNFSICFVLINFRVLEYFQEDLRQGDLDNLYFTLNDYHLEGCCLFGI